MKCEICDTEFKMLEIVYRLRTLKQSSLRGGETSVVLIDTCKKCAASVMQVDEQGVELKRNDKRRII